ncbi:metallophosphoesterase [Halobellus ruber]|uniref:Metallophosphoesterase family protein n=1 Tax=Halobellus ruber TaxID=2761102 RepID=A0A7J9SLQ0_9EURY|nr:metallophosphoesterase [Halobellus ruber]MBB6645951.1 metallophosphoesterase family protein [Halobellus ruber]
MADATGIGDADPLVEPLPGDPAAVVRIGDGETALVVADYHAGIEAGLRYERGVELESDADLRRIRLLGLLDRTDPDRLVVLGDLGHRVGGADGTEAEELDDLLAAVLDRVPVTLVPGNHDTGVGDRFAAESRFAVADRTDTRLGRVGFAHGHTWPSRDALGGEVLCIGHEHPAVRLEDSVGGGRKERAWLRGPLRSGPFAEHFGIDASDLAWTDPELVVFPAFNDRSGGTWVNVEGQGFLSPFLPDALVDSRTDAYLLDGTRLGPYRSV